LVDLSESVSALLLLVVAVQLLQELVDVCGGFCPRALGSLMVSDIAGLAFLALLFLDLVRIGGRCLPSRLASGLVRPP